MSDHNLFVKFCESNGFVLCKEEYISNGAKRPAPTLRFGCDFSSSHEYAREGGVYRYNVSNDSFTSMYVYSPQKVYGYSKYDEFMQDINSGKVKFLTVKEYNAEFKAMHKPLLDLGFKVKNRNELVSGVNMLSYNKELYNHNAGVNVTCQANIKGTSYEIYVRNQSGKYKFHSYADSLNGLLNTVSSVRGEAKKPKVERTPREFETRFCSNFYLESPRVISGSVLDSIEGYRLMYRDGADFHNANNANSINAKEFYICIDVTRTGGITSSLLFDFDVSKYSLVTRKPGGSEVYYQPDVNIMLSKNDHEMVKLYIAERVKL